MHTDKIWWRHSTFTLFPRPNRVHIPFTIWNFTTFHDLVNVQWLCFVQYSLFVFFAAATQWRREMERNGKHYIHPVSDEVYDTLLLLVQGKFEVPVSKQTRIQRNTVVRFWRRRDDFHLGPERTPTLYFAGKKVFKKSLISTIPVEIPSNKQNLEAAKSYDNERPAVMQV